MKFQKLIINFISLSFILFVLVSCEKIKDIFTDEYAFLKGEWVLEDIEINQSRSGSQYPEDAWSHTLSCSYTEDSLLCSHKDFQKEDDEVVSDTSYTIKYSYLLQLSITDSIKVSSKVSNLLYGFELDTAFLVGYEIGDYDNKRSFMAPIPVEYYAVKISFGKNNIFIIGERPNDKNILYIKKDQEENKLVIEYTSKIFEPETYYLGEYKYTFKRKQ